MDRSRAARRSILVTAFLVAFAAATSGACMRPAASPSAGPERCSPQDVLLEGACVRPRVAQRWCGPSATLDAHEGIATCLPNACDGAQVLDDVTSECVGARALLLIAQGQHVAVLDDQTLGCRHGAALHLAAGHLRCVEQKAVGATALPRVCHRGDVWDGRACARVEKSTVDVVTWAQATFGRSASPFCARATRDPIGLTFAAAGSMGAQLEAEIDLIFLDNDVSAVRAVVAPASSTTGVGRGQLTSAVDVEIEVLRAFGGTASVASLRVHVACPYFEGSSPLAVPNAARP